MAWKIKCHAFIFLSLSLSPYIFPPLAHTSASSAARHVKSVSGLPHAAHHASLSSSQQPAALYSSRSLSGCKVFKEASAKMRPEVSRVVSRIWLQETGAQTRKSHLFASRHRFVLSFSIFAHDYSLHTSIPSPLHTGFLNILLQTPHRHHLRLTTGPVCLNNFSPCWRTKMFCLGWQFRAAELKERKRVQL